MHFIYLARGERFIKLGLSTQPKQRGYEISRQFRARGDRMLQMKVFPPSPFAFGVESSVAKELSRMASTTHGREWFEGLNFDLAQAHVRRRVMWLRQAQLFQNLQEPDLAEVA
jgi:hypothetical protein